MNATKPEPETLRRVDDSDGEKAVVGAAWFSSAFSVAIGGSTSEALSRFDHDLRALVNCAQTKDMAAYIGPDEFLKRVEALQFRMSVAAEWAERLEKLEDAR